MEDGDYMKESFINISEYLFADLKNKTEIIQKIKDMPLSAKTVKERTIQIAATSPISKSRTLIQRQHTQLPVMSRVM